MEFPKITFQPGQTARAVRLSSKDHPKMGQCATIVVALINPSKRREHQWYDVRFDDGVYGRFLERYLERIPQVSETRVA